MEINTLRQTYFKNEDFHIEYQIYLNTVWVHATVNKWSPRVAKRGYIVFARMQKEYKDKGFHKFISISPNPAFCKMYGGISLAKINYENKEHEVVVWELK